jgi:RND family efflux transporter MFP subunit
VIYHSTSLSYLSGLFLSISLLSGCSKAPEQVTEQNSYHQVAEIQSVKPSNSYQVQREYIGKVVSKQLSSVSFEYSGKVNQILVDSGDVVKAGQLLAALDTELLTINAKEIDARISQLTAQARLNRLNLERITKLNKKGYTSQQTLDELQTEKNVINADLARQQSNQAALNYQISKAKLYAPFDAIVSIRTIDEGEIFSRTQAAFQLIKQSQNEISVGVPIKVANRLVVGQTIEVDIAEQSLKAQLLVIGNQINDISRTVELRLSIDQQGTLYNGQLVQVTIEQTIKKTGFWLPLSSLTDGVRGQWNIYLVEPRENNLFEIKPATISVQYSTLDAVFISGLGPQEQQVITSGVHRFVPGQLVKRFSQNTAKTKTAGQVQ